MNSILLLLVLSVGVFAQTWTDTIDGFGQTASWAGNTSDPQSATFYPPNYPISQSECSPRSQLGSYVAATKTFATSGVRQVGLMAEFSFKPYIELYIYNGTFTPTSPCANIVRRLTYGDFIGQSGVMKVNDFFFFRANVQYTLLVTSSNNQHSGSFGVAIFGSTFVGTTVGQPSAVPATAVFAGCTPSNLVASPVTTITWTHTNANNAVTASYDILVMFANTNVDTVQLNSASFGLWLGNVTAEQLNASSCPSGATILTWGNEGDLSAGVLRYSLRHDLIYTISVQNNYPLPFAVQILPTRVRTRSSASFAQPNRIPPCAANSSATAAGYVGPFAVTAAYNMHFFDTYATPEYSLVQAFPEITFAYQGGSFSGPNLDACPSGATLLAAANTGAKGSSASVAPVSNGPLWTPTTIGQSYTLVVSSLDGQNLNTPPTTPANALWGTQLFVIAGNMVSGTTNSTTGTAGTTTGTITAAGTTTDGTSNGSTGTTNSTSGTGNGTGTGTGTGTGAVTTAAATTTPVSPTMDPSSSSSSSLVLSALTLLAIIFVLF